MSKHCEVCGIKIPDDYGNLLCDTHYADADKRKAERVAAELERTKKAPESPIFPANVGEVDPTFGIKDPDYKENPQADDKDQVLANLAQFIYTHDPVKGRTGKLLWYPTRNMYTYIKNYCIAKISKHPQYPKYVWKPKIVDVGCGSGVGSNILSLEGDFVWGIDKNAFSIEFAKEAFQREKNGIYYSSQLTFDNIDIMTENRELMKFDIVVAIEIIEHIKDTDTFLKQLITLFTKRDKRGRPLVDDLQMTEFFFSTPNRNSPKINKEKPANEFHVREWTSQEFHELLSKYFNNVFFMNNKGEPVEVDCKDDIVFAKCSSAK